MKIKLSIATALMVLTLVLVRAADTNDAKTELMDLVDKIKIKLKAGQNTAADLAPELKQFDALLAEHKGEKTDDVAKILLMKATLYSEVLHDNATGDALMKQLETDYAGTQLVTTLKLREEQQKESKKIQSALVTGATFPDFSEKDVSGKPLSVAGLKGKIVLVDFWATWCPPCRAEIPNVVAAYNKFHAKGFEIIGVSLDEEQPKLLAYTKEQGMAWPQFFDGQRWNNKLAVKYGIQSIPSSFLLDGNGKIIARDLRGDELADAVAKAVASN